MEKNEIDWETGAPVTVILLHDTDGSFGQKVAESWVLAEQIDEEERQKYNNFILDRQNSLAQEMANLFSQMELQRHIVFATKKEIKEGRVKNMLTDLFDVTYNQRIPFPFDGFYTARGNAAKDCQQFTIQLLLGRLDKEWIAAQSQQQRNRAYEVLDKSWGILSEDGSIRIKPTNKAVCNIVDLLESKLPPTDNEVTGNEMNLGLLCAFFVHRLTGVILHLPDWC